jgi:hypothetical protein
MSTVYLRNRKHEAVILVFILIVYDSSASALAVAILAHIFQVFPCDVNPACGSMQLVLLRQRSSEQGVGLRGGSEAAESPIERNSASWHAEHYERGRSAA